MTKDWENIFNSWSHSPSKTEQERCERVIRAIRNAIDLSPKLKARQILVFPQGSSYNRVEIGVMLHEPLLPQYQVGKSNTDFGNVDFECKFNQLKDELEEALASYFGRSVVTRGNKAFEIKATASHVAVDVVLLFEFRHYLDNGGSLARVALIPDDTVRLIENFTEFLLSSWPTTPRHYENGVSKNTATNRRFKGMARILKKLCNEMGDAGNVAAQAVPSYLLECLVWNAPNTCFNYHTWEDRVQSVMQFLWCNTMEHSLCSEWCEVDTIKYLFHGSQPWTRQQAHDFIDVAWLYVGVRSKP